MYQIEEAKALRIKFEVAPFILSVINSLSPSNTGTLAPEGSNAWAKGTGVEILHGLGNEM